MDNKNYVASVDLGSSNIVMAVGKVDATGTVKVETVLSYPSSGIEMGVIQNVNDVCDQLCAMKKQIEGELGIRIKEVYAGVSGDFIRYHTYSDHVFVADTSDGIVSQSDVDALNDRMNRVTVQEDELVMDRFPLNYVLDNKRETEKPVGAFSQKLSSTFAFVVGRKQPLGRLKMVFDKAGLRLAGIFANSAIIADAVLNSEEKNDGVAVVDIGGGTTDVAVYYGGIVRYAATIPMGGKAIDSDINKHGVPVRNIEDLKKMCGSAISENVSPKECIRIPIPGHGPKKIMRRNLANIIEARLMDIAEYVKTELKDSGFGSKLAYGVVLTGGTAATPEIDSLFARLLECEVRVATASEGIDESSRQNIDSPEYTAAVALLITGAAKGACEVECVASSATDNAADERVNESAVDKLDFPKEKQPYTPPKSTAKTYEPPKRNEVEPPVRQVPKPVTPAAPVTAPEPVPAPEPEEPEKEPAKPVEEKKTDADTVKPKKRGFLGNFVGALTDMFQGGESFGDTSLNASADGKNAGEKAPQKPRLNPKSRTELGEFFVDGEDKEEI